MKLQTVLITIIIYETNCFIFDDRNETMKMNRFCNDDDGTVPEGNIGQAAEFPWLGILRAHIHKEGASLEIAVTGIVLIKDKFALANANDVVRIPRNVFRLDTKVMFVTEENEPWFCNVVDYTTHPEFEITTYNTVAVIELQFPDMSRKVHPICWPYKNFNTSDQLYGIGFTDEHQLLEKTIYKLEYVEKTLCDEFYKRSNLTEDGLIAPVSYQCAYGQRSTTDCQWDTGMVVASNVSGYWTLTGMIIGGPGCSAPAKFLDTTSYMSWIITTMDLDNDDWTGDVMRRSAFGTGFKRKNKMENKNISSV